MKDMIKLLFGVVILTFGCSFACWIYRASIYQGLPMKQGTYLEFLHNTFLFLQTLKIY